MSAPNIDLVESDDDSIIEVIQPTKPLPIVVDVDIEEEIVLNISNTPVFLTPTRPVNVTVRNKAPNNDSEKDTSSGSDAISPYHWTNDMKTFYNDDYETEDNFCLEKLLGRMPSDRKFWNVNRQTMPSSRRTICFKCNCYHKNQYCRSNSCHMCGTEGHLAVRCPQRMCLTCGKRGKSFVAACELCRRNRSRKCVRCRVNGHTVMDCTDNWRRFHNVTAKGAAEFPEEAVLKPTHQMWCSNCSRQGHLEVCCNVPREDVHLLSSTLVSSYESSFQVDKAGGRDYRKTLARKRTKTPNLVQTPSNSDMKRKRYFVMPSEEDDSTPKIKKKKEGFGTNNSPVTFGSGHQSKPSPCKRPSALTQEQGPNIENFSANIQKENGGVASYNKFYASLIGQPLFQGPSANNSSITTEPECMTPVPKNFKPNKKNNSAIRANNTVISIDEAVDGPSSSFSHINTTERNISSSESRKVFTTPEFIPLNSKKKPKKTKWPKSKKNKPNKTEVEPISVKKALIEQNKTFKKKRDKRINKFIERRLIARERKFKKNQLNQNQQPSTPSALPSLLSLKIQPPPRPRHNQKQAVNQKGAIQRWNNYLLGV